MPNLATSHHNAATSGTNLLQGSTLHVLPQPVRSYTNYSNDFTPVERALYLEYKRLAAHKNRDKDREAYNEKHRLRMRETRARKRAERQALATTQGA